MLTCAGACSSQGSVPGPQVSQFRLQSTWNAAHALRGHFPFPTQGSRFRKSNLDHPSRRLSALGAGPKARGAHSASVLGRQPCCPSLLLHITNVSLQQGFPSVSREGSWGPWGLHFENHSSRSGFSTSALLACGWLSWSLQGAGSIAVLNPRDARAPTQPKL